MKTKNKTLSLILLIIVTAAGTSYAFESGAHLQLRSDFSGGVTTPEISEESLKYLNARATKMSGTMSELLMGGEVEAGYIFRSHDFFGLKKTNPFSGIGTFLFLGFSQGNTSQKITAAESGQEFDIFMSVNFLPVVNFGFTGKVYFFDNRLAIGTSFGGRMIADMSPEYLCYSTMPELIPMEIGRIIVSEDMMKKMNPFMFSSKFLIEYNIHVLPTTEVVLGSYVRYNVYRPKYLTVPPSLLNMAVKDNPEFDINRAHPDYWINSLDFGVTIGLAFKL